MEAVMWDTAWFSTIQIVKNTHGGVLLLVKLHNFCIKYIDLLVKLHGEEGSEFFQFPFRHYQLLQYILIAFVLGKFCRNISKARNFFFFFFFFFFFWSSRKTTWLVSMWKGHWSLNGWTCKYYLQKPSIFVFIWKLYVDDFILKHLLFFWCMRTWDIWKVKVC